MLFALYLFIYFKCVFLFVLMRSCFEFFSSPHGKNHRRKPQDRPPPRQTPEGGILKAANVSLPRKKKTNKLKSGKEKLLIESGM